MKKTTAIAMILGWGLLLAAGAWAYGGRGHHGGIMFGGGGASVFADQGGTWAEGYCPAWGSVMGGANPTDSQTGGQG